MARDVFDPIVVTPAINVVVDGYAYDYQTKTGPVLGLASIDTATWAGFCASVRVLSFDGTPNLFFKLQHSAVNPADVSYECWEDLIQFPPCIARAGLYFVEVGPSAAFARWLRATLYMTGTSGHTASLADLTITPRG